ncbi:MAG: complement resistance protein TraT [Phycisphaerales bacterium JB060]
MQDTVRKPLIAIALTAGMLAIAATSGCTAAARGLGKVTANKYASAQSGTVWVVPPPDHLEPPAPEDKNVYISYRNISDADIDLTQLLRDAARAQGWQLVANPQEATYRLRATTRFFGEVQPESGGADAARAMGWISGAAVGVGTYALVESATDSWAAGAASGAAAGGLVGLGMTNASKVREWALITDFVLEEYSPEPIEFEMLAERDSSGTTTAGVGSGRAADGGATSQTSGSTATTKRTSNYFPHGVRLSAWANQMNMKEGEAMPLITERVERVVAQMLPQ